MSFKYKDKMIAGSGGGSSEEIYSTDEVRIGTWIDGKPLYRMVIETTTPSSGGNSVTLYTLNSVSIIKCIGYVIIASGSRLPITNIGNTSQYIGIYWNDNRIMYNSAGTIYNSRPCVLIIEYTKTTDQATIQIQESSQLSKNEMQEKSDYQDFTAPVTAGI